MINPVDAITVRYAITIRYGDTPMTHGPSGTSVMCYFDMWNTGDTAIADQVLHPDWVDHAHPEVAGPDAVKQAVAAVRAARPDLRFTVHSIMGGDDLVAVVGSVGVPRQSSDSPGSLVWLVRLVDGLMAEMWTYQQNQPAR